MKTLRRSTLAALSLSCAIALSAIGAPGCAVESADEPVEDNLVGGTAESGHLAAGYLASTASPSTPLCGATLIGKNVVVTAAHCVYRNEDQKLVFGVGELGKKSYDVAQVVYHPKVHLEQQGFVDPIHALRLYDVAYLVLDKPVADVEPVQLAASKPVTRCNTRLIGYGADASDKLIRKGVDGCVVLNAKLGSDTIVEIRPRMGGAVCHRDGDEGHAAIQVGADGRATLLGLYVGSVTGNFTDCRRYAQLLNGYEATFGYRDFYEEGIRRGQSKL